MQSAYQHLPEADAGNPSGRPAGNGWMVTFVDLVSLMLTFFVMLFAMSNVTADRWGNLVEAMAHQLNPSRETTQPLKSDTQGIGQKQEFNAINLDYLAEILQRDLPTNPELDGVVVRRLDDRLAVSLPGDLAFAPGSARFAKAGRAALGLLGSSLSKIDNRIEVYGHTDPSPRRAGPYASNWELSLDRALAVAAEMRRVGYRREIAAYGLGDSRYADLSTALPEVERLMLARRVDIIIRPTVGEP